MRDALLALMLTGASGYVDYSLYQEYGGTPLIMFGVGITVCLGFASAILVTEMFGRKSS